MLNLKCKNCGGNIKIDNASQKLICVFCGTEQSIESVFENNKKNIFCNDSAEISLIFEYATAMQAINNPYSEDILIKASETLQKLSKRLDCSDIAVVCRQKAEFLRKERIYNEACLYMNSNNLTDINKAINKFHSLTDYLDSNTKLEECRIKIKIIETKLLKERTEELLLNKKKLAKQKLRRRILLFSTAIILSLIIICHYVLYSKSNVKIKIKPSKDNYFTMQGNNYVFSYDLKIMNNGFKDINGIEVTIFIENNRDEVLVDTSINLYNNSSAVVRAKKSSKHIWTLTVYSENTALELYETDFDDLQVNVDIHKITYTNGKTKTY